MSRWALVNQSIVVNVIEQDTQPTVVLDPWPNAVWMACPDWVSVNDEYKNGQFERPPSPAQKPIITKLAMINRFEDSEYVGILTAAKTDVEVEAWNNRFNAASYVDLSNQETIDGMNFLVSKNLITAARANEILTTPVSSDEVPS